MLLSIGLRSLIPQSSKVRFHSTVTIPASSLFKLSCRLSGNVPLVRADNLWLSSYLIYSGIRTFTSMESHRQNSIGMAVGHLLAADLTIRTCQFDADSDTFVQALEHPGEIRIRRNNPFAMESATSIYQTTAFEGIDCGRSYLNSPTIPAQMPSCLSLRSLSGASCTESLK